MGRRAPEAATTLLSVVAVIAFAVKRGQRAREPLIIFAKRIVFAAEGEAPATLAVITHLVSASGSQWR
ncbi:MAG: hypothetical protein M0D54_19690 [Hyphomonadaceae bacterium JAD_PAG50586_4]|nr:MAG: hypothetical protein M0D54_19690 [Hyphomonadaceae bacterium JAD_PAG50586_4]